jgi:aryl-alcohol dehydrogenase-like predicted oxidoreductase
MLFEMDFRLIGLTGVSISTIGLGGFELGPIDGAVPDVDNAVSVLRTTLEAGINWFDTSENYNDSGNESLIGAALEQVPNEFVISTKVAPYAAITGGASGFKREQVHSAVRGSLTRLGVDVIDVYFLHYPDQSGVPLEETWGAMAELVEQGLVRAIGISNYSLEEIERCHAQRPVDIVQTGLSMIDYLDDRTMIARCGELGIAVVTFEPVASGILTDKSIDQIYDMWAPTWSDTAAFKRLLGPGRVERSAAVADGLRLIADRLGAAAAQVAIAWVLRQPGVTAAIAGSKDGRHVSENAAASDLDLTGVLDELEALIPFGPNFD